MAARRNSESAPGSARAVRGEPHDEPATLPAPSPSKPSAQPRLQTALGLREDEPPRPSPSSTSFASAEFVVSQAGSSRTLRSASGTGGLDGALDFADESDLAAAFHEAEPHLMMPQRRRQSATDDSHKGHGKGLHVAFVPVEGDPHSTADSGSHDVPVVPMMTIRLPSEPGASTPTGGRAQPPTFFPNFPSSAPSPPRAVQFIGTSGGSSAILPSQQSRASNSSDRERQLEAEVESLRQQLASRDRALERREKFMNAMQLVQGVVELSEDGNTVTMVECTNAHLIGLLPPSSALFISEGQGPHPKLSPGVYLPPSSARLRTPARTQVTSPQATFGVAATSEGLNHPLRQSIKAASNSSLGSLVSRDIASRDDDRNNVEEPMDYFSTLHHSSGSGDFTPTANTVTHRSVSRVAPDSVEGSVFSGPVPMDGGDPTFVNFTAASPSTTLFDKRHVVAGNDAAADSLSTSVGSQHTDRRPPTLGSLPTPGQLPAGLHSSFLTYLHMLRSVQQPREESPLNAEAAIPGFPGTRTSVPESPMEGPRPSMYRKRANTLASSTTSSLESALRSWRFDYSPAMRDPGTPGSGSSRELESRSWSVACFPVPSVEDARDPALEGSSKVGLSSAGRSSSTFRLPSDRVRAGFVMYDVTSYRKEVHRVEERCKTRDRELKQRVDFLSQVSHEIRTPLHGLLGFTSLLDVSTGLTQDQRDLLKAIRDCSESLHSIVSEFLDWSKLESGKAELEINPFDLRETVASLGMIWKLQGSRKGLSRLGVEVEDTVPRIVYGDVERLKQVLNNMLSNATKFTPPGGTVDLKVSCSGVPISAMRAPSGPFAHASGTMSIGSGAGGTASRSGSIASASGPIVPGGAVYLVTFSVWDSGIGISPAGRAKLFQNYAQADSSISRRFGGTGLGLAISRGIVELMGGKMDVESSDEPGQSFSRFWIEIPLTVAPETLISPMPGPGLGTGFANETRRRSAWVTNYAVSEDAPVAEQAPLKLLVAEDNPLNQKLIQRLLGKLGYNELQIVGDGKECFEKVLEASKAKQPFDLVFMDVQMPVCDGLEATERIRASEELSQAGDQPFVVAMSAGVMPEDQDRCYEVGMDSFLAKPLNMSDLIATLKRFWNELVERRGSEGSESEEPADAGPGPL